MTEPKVSLMQQIHDSTMPRVVWECPTAGLLIYHEPRHSRFRVVREWMEGSRRHTVDVELTPKRAEMMARAILDEVVEL